MKRKLLRTLLLLLMITAGAGAWLAGSENGLRWLLPRVATALGGELTYDTLHGRLIGPMELSGAQFHSPAYTLHVQHLILDWHPLWLLAGSVDVDSPRMEQLTVTLGPDAAAGPPTGATPAPPPATSPTTTVPRLPLRIVLHDAQVTGIRIVGPAGSAPRVIDHVYLSGSYFGRTLRFPTLQVEAGDYALALNGRARLRDGPQVDLETRAAVSLAGYPRLQGTVRIQGDAVRLRAQIGVEAPFTAHVNAEAQQLQADPTWQAQLDLKELVPQKIQPAWPPLRLSGRAQAQGHGQNIQVEGDISASGEDRGQVHVVFKQTGAKANTNAPTYSLALTWRDIHVARLPLGSVTVEALGAPAGELQVDGTARDFRYTLQTSLQHARTGDMHFAADGRGDARQVRAKVQAQALGAALEGTLSWPRTGKDDWHVEMAARGVDPGKLLPQWPGKLRLDATLHGNARRTVVDRATVSGTLRGQPLHLATRLAMEGGRYRVDQFDVRAGSGTADLRGEWGPQVRVRWDVQAPDLSPWWPDTHGALYTSGTIDGPRATPGIVARLRAQGLRLAGYGVERASAQLDMDLLDRRDGHAQAELTGLVSPQGRLASFRLQAHGRQPQHTIDMALATADAQATLTFTGAWRRDHWQGSLARADVESTTTGPWRLEGPTELRLGRSAWQVNALCLRHDTSRVCADGAWHAGHGWRANATLAQLPLSWLQPLFATDVGLSGNVDGTLSAQAADTAPLQATIDLTFPPGDVHYPSQGETHVRADYSGGRAQLHVADGRGTAHVSLRLEKDGWLDGELEFPFAGTAAPGADRRLRGYLKGGLHDLSPLALFFPQFYRTQGELDANVRILGSTDDPRFAGSVVLDKGSVGIPRLGITLQGLRLALRGGDGDALQVEGAVRSGDGSLRLDGDVRLQNPRHWSTRLRLRGDRFVLAHTPELYLLATPDLTLEAQPRTLRVDGRIEVPEARIAPKKLARASLASSDVVIVDDSDAADAAPKWQIYSNIQLNLGHKVHFSAFNIDTDVDGNIIVADEPDRPTTALGELRINRGKFSAYGQSLTIERGRLLFASGPIDDPGLDIRATRRSGEVLAGVLARGSLKAPELTLFSEPAMSQTDALSYLVLGHAADQAAGADAQLLYQAATSVGLVGGEFLAKKIGHAFGIQEVAIETGTKPEDTRLALGTYLSPRLYISYGIGLLEPVNTFRLRYTLSKRWQFQTESGTAAGADLLYTIER